MHTPAAHQAIENPAAQAAAAGQSVIASLQDGMRHLQVGMSYTVPAETCDQTNCPAATRRFLPFKLAVADAAAASCQ